MLFEWVIPIILSSRSLICSSISSNLLLSPSSRVFHFSYRWGTLWAILRHWLDDLDLGVCNTRWLWFLKKSRQVLWEVPGMHRELKGREPGSPTLPSSYSVCLSTVPGCPSRAKKQCREGEGMPSSDPWLTAMWPGTFFILCQSSLPYLSNGSTGCLTELEVLCQKYLSKTDARKWGLILKVNKENCLHCWQPFVGVVTTGFHPVNRQHFRFGAQPHESWPHGKPG